VSSTDLSQLPFARPDADTRPLSNFFVGGTAAWLVQVRTLPELQDALRAIRAAGLPWMMLGAGTNTVFPPR
jgi:UDP-N-acetylenolpyruvoylglucosamine reductase